MHSKYDRLVVFLIVCGSLLMLFGAVYYLFDYLSNSRVQETEENSEFSHVIDLGATQASALEDSGEAQAVDNAFVNAIIDAVNDERNEEKIFNSFSLQQRNQVDLNDFKLYINNLREAAGGKIIGVKSLSSIERRSIELEMLNNDPLNNLYVKNYVFYYLVSQIPENSVKRVAAQRKKVAASTSADKGVSAADNNADQVLMATDSTTNATLAAVAELTTSAETAVGKLEAETATTAKLASEKLNLLVLDKAADGHLRLSNNLVGAMLEPYYTIKLYVDALANEDISLLANIIYTDTPSDISLRLAKAQSYLKYYKTQIVAGGKHYRIEEIRPDQWIISFELDEAAPNVEGWEINKQVLAKLDSESRQFQESDSQRYINYDLTTENEDHNDFAFEHTQQISNIRPYSKLNYWPKYYERFNDSKRHYVKFARHNNNMTAIDVLPLDRLTGAWTLVLLDKNYSHVNMLENVNLLHVANIFEQNGSFRPLNYKEASYNSLLLPRLEGHEKAAPLYKQLWNYNSDYVEAYSFIEDGKDLNTLSIDMLRIKGDKVKTTSALQLGMTRREIIALYPGIDAANYLLIKDGCIMELRFDNQSDGGQELTLPAADDILIGISYYNQRWSEQNVDLLNVEVASSYVPN